MSVGGKTVQAWCNAVPVLKKVTCLKPVFWNNPRYRNITGELLASLPILEKEVNQAADDLDAFAAFMTRAFPETEKTGGIIESDLVELSSMKERLETFGRVSIPGRLYLKKDSHLPVSGSIKARGGFYAVLCHARALAIRHGILLPDDDLSALSTRKADDFFSGYTISVGSTGNLGLSIGIMGTRLGFTVTVHMSQEAKPWKKDLLRSKGASVIEHGADYGMAVENGRKEAAQDPKIFFVDDENSKELFLGYAVAGQRLKTQLQDANIRVDDAHPLFVYLPCGVGGSPGGIALGLKQVFQDHVHCFFAEPTHAPAMLLGLSTGLMDRVSAADFGIDGRTAADGLACSRPSGLAATAMDPLLSGIYTLSDPDLFRLLALLKESAGIYMEPSALASAAGPYRLFRDPEGRQYLKEKGLVSIMGNATHVIWGTGGSMVPGDIQSQDDDKGIFYLNTNEDTDAV